VLEVAAVRDAWLQPLARLLKPLGADRLALVAGLVVPLRAQWVERLTGEAQLADPDDADLVGRSGWLFQLPGDSVEPQLLFAAARDEAAVSAALLDAAVALVRASWRLQLGAGDEEGAAETGEAIHALRNSLNSVLMSAAVITTCADLLPERLQPIAREIEAAAERSVQRLHRLTGLVETRR
jgi:hypothetical protein